MNDHLPSLPGPLGQAADSAHCGSGCGAQGCASGGKCAPVSEEPRALSPDDASTGDTSTNGVSASGAAPSALLPAPTHVLATLEKDGRRRWLQPKLARGKWWKRRRLLAYVLMVVFVAVPHLRLAGEPLVRLDIVARKFVILGHTFLPTDTLLLALLILLGMVSIVLCTTLIGRVWCGWACPQTVYIEFLFRPIDRLFDGTFGKGGRPKTPPSFILQLARVVTYLVLTSILAHTLLAYFVGTDQLAQWLLGSPFEHPVAFLVMALTTGLLAYNFLYFREQTCMIACPYGRFQSVMLDPNSIIVAYDDVRGEPRKKGKRKPGNDAGDCVDCNQCVVVCPTGIDIRNGLQMECINCTQCIDACDAVMDKVGLPQGLIRYTSQEALKHRSWRLLRPRTIVYPAILLILLSAFVLATVRTTGFDARILRGKGAPFVQTENGLVSNTFNVRLVNRQNDRRSYSFTLVQPGDGDLEVIDADLLSLEGGKSSIVPIQIVFPSAQTRSDGNTPAQLLIEDDHQLKTHVNFRLLGPR